MTDSTTDDLQGGTPADEFAGGSPAAPAPRAHGFGAALARLGSESLIYGLSAIVARFLSYLLQPFYASQFTTSDNGIQTLVYTVLSLVSVVFVLGLDVAYMRGAAQAAADAATPADAERARQRAFTMSLTSICTVGTALLALGFVLVPRAATMLGLPPWSLRYLLGIVFTDAILAVPWAHLRMTNRALRFAIYRIVFVLLSIGLNLGLILGLGWGVEAIFFANLAANGALLLLFLPEIGSLFRPALLRQGADWRALAAYALPIVPAALAVLVVENADKLVLNQMPDAIARAVYAKTPREVVGVYGFNYKLGIVMLLVVQMFRMAWTPFSLGYARRPGAPQLFSRVLTALVLACCLVFLGVSMFLPLVVHIPSVYGFAREPAYWDGLPIVPVILLGYIFSGIYAVTSAGLYIEKATKELPWIAGAGAIVNVGLCIVGVRFGMVAVAWATPVSYALMAAAGAWRANRVYPVPFEWLRLVHVAIIVAAVFAASVWLDAHGYGPEWRFAWGEKALLVAAFPTLLILTGFFRAGEWRAVESAAARLAKTVRVRR